MRKFVTSVRTETGPVIQASRLEAGSAALAFDNTEQFSGRVAMEILTINSSVTLMTYNSV